MLYITFDEYQELGGISDLTAFSRNIDRASGIITNATHNRVATMLNVPREVKTLCRDLIDYLENNVSRETQIASRSQTAGSVSESISYQTKDNETQTTDIDNMVVDYLLSVKDDNGTPLLYRGCAV